MQIIISVHAFKGKGLEKERRTEVSSGHEGRRWAIVTGGSAGIGHGIATQLIADGINVIVVARNQERLEAAAANLRSACEVDQLVLSFVADLPNDAGIESLFDFVGSSIDHLDIMSPMSAAVMSSHSLSSRAGTGTTFLT